AGWSGTSWRSRRTRSVSSCGAVPTTRPPNTCGPRRVADLVADSMPDDPDGLHELRAVARDVARDPETGWKQWAELGWVSLLVPEERGGAGADEYVAAVIARELGAAGRREPFVAAGVLTTTLLAGL